MRKVEEKRKAEEKKDRMVRMEGKKLRKSFVLGSPLHWLNWQINSTSQFLILPTLKSKGDVEKPQPELKWSYYRKSHIVEEPMETH